MRFAALALAFLFPPLAALAQDESDFERKQAEFKAERAWESAGWTGGDVVVAEVVSLPDDPGTNEAPPTIGLRIVRVIHGDEKLDRSKAVWSPAWPFEWGICGNDTRIKPWHAEKFSEMPKVGETYLFVAEYDARNPSPCRADGSSRRLLTEAFEKKALAWYDEGSKKGREFVAKKAADEKRVSEDSEAFWTSKMAGAKLEDLFAQGDFIGVGRICSGGGYPVAYFEITELLRGPRMHDYTHGSYFASMNTPKGGDLAFPDQKRKYLLVLAARGTECPGGDGGPFYEVLPGDRGVLPLTDANVAAARDWCRAHPADPAAEKEIVARCTGWSAARTAEGCFRWIDISLKCGDKFRPLPDQDSGLSAQIDRAEDFFKHCPEDARRRARLDKDYRATLARALLLRAGVCALRSAGLEERGGTPQEIAPARADQLRRFAFEMIERALRETEVTRGRLVEEEDLQGLKADDRWAKVLEGAGK